MDSSFFYFAGGALVVLALIVSFIGLRYPDFPSSRGALLGGVAAVALVVAATATGAVLKAQDEQENRDAEAAQKAAASDATQEGQGSATAEETGTEGPSGATQGEQQAAQEQQAASKTLKLTSPEDGGLTFDPPKLSAKAGTVTIDYTNPSPVGHSVAIETKDGQALDAGDIVESGAVSSATADLKPGDYVYYCTVPGHAEAGMEGTLTVK